MKRCYLFKSKALACIVLRWELDNAKNWFFKSGVFFTTALTKQTKYSYDILTFIFIHTKITIEVRD